MDRGAARLTPPAADAARTGGGGAHGGAPLRSGAGRLWDVVPGEIAVVRPNKPWSYAGHPYLPGSIESTRVDLAALALTPLEMEERGVWDPDQHYWGEEGEPIEDWARPIIARGQGRNLKWSKCCPGRIPTIRSTIRS
jgi:hypothetical protein